MPARCPTGSLADVKKRRDMTEQQACHAGDIDVLDDPGFEAAGNCADRTFQILETSSCREDLCQHQRQLVGVHLVGVHPASFIQPIRPVDGLFHPSSMKRTVRESIDREDIEPVSKEEITKCLQLVRLSQRLDRLRRKTEPDAERAVGSNP